MSLKKKAAQVRAAGHKNSRQDSMLAHITPEEAAFLKRGGGSGRKDPKTGLPHYEGFGDSDTGGFSDSGGYGGDTGYGGGYGMTGYDVGPPTQEASQAISSDFAGSLADYATGPSYTEYDPAMSAYGYNDVAMGPPTQEAAQDLGGQFANSISGYQTAEESFADKMAKKAKSLAMGQVASKLGIPGPVMGIANIATAKSPEAQARGFGNMASSIGLGALGPLGMAAGALGLGNMFGNALASFEGTRTDADRAAASAATGAAGRAAGGSGGYNTPGFDLGGTLAGLAGLYQGNKAAESSKQAAGLAQGQAQQLADLYGPNSPYAAQLRQQLERKDAAAGRRSQYGPREVELQARLADVASRNAPNVLAANQSAQTLRQQGQTTRGQQLAGALSLANKTGLTGMAQRGLQGLYGSFGGGGGTTGNEGFSLGDMSYNNPSAYVAPSAGFEWPSAQGAYDFAAEAGNNASSFWD